jgi:Helix-turn-helix domain
MLVELSVVEQRYHAVMEVLSGSIPVVEVAERYRVSRKRVHAWLRRFRQDGLPADQSQHHPGQLAPAVYEGTYREPIVDASKPCSTGWCGWRAPRCRSRWPPCTRSVVLRSPRTSGS